MRRHLLLFVPLTLFAAGPPRFARLSDFQGAVEVQLRAGDPWIAAERNLPLPESAWVRTGAASRVEIELDEGSAVRAGANSQFEISDCSRLSTGQRVTMITLDHGIAYLTGRPEGRDALSVAVPGAQAALAREAHIRVEVQEQWSQIAAIEGSVRFSSPAAEFELREGQTTRVEPANPARFFLYREVLPNDLDRWNEERDQALAVSPSAAHVIQRYGVADLDHSGNWILTADMGPIWKPKAEDDWMPFAAGRWRWYDSLGYTWVPDEAWGWLPYHYGRWTHLENLGWVWVPSKNGIFKPGEVYWVRGDRFVGWGPLGPGEQWDPADPVNRVPQQFLETYTTYAAPQPPGETIDPAGFEDGPDDPLKEATFLAALPSPAILAAHLDAVRPFVVSARRSVNPVVEGTRYETPIAAPVRTLPAPAPAPVVIVTPPSPPPDPEVVEVPVPVPVPAGIVFVTPPKQHHATAASTTKTVAASTPPPGGSNVTGRPGPHDPPRKPTAPADPGKKFKNPAEERLFNAVLRDLETKDYERSLRDLENWTDHYRETDYAAERSYYTMLAYNGMKQPVKVIDAGGALFQKDVSLAFTDPMQVLSAAYVAAENAQQIRDLTRAQLSTAQAAGRTLLAMLPVCFTPERKPREMSDGDWAKSRTELETLARNVMKRGSH